MSKSLNKIHYAIIRLNTSSYQDDDFLNKEKTKLLQALDHTSLLDKNKWNFSYFSNWSDFCLHHSKNEKNLKLILISNTHTKFENIPQLDQYKIELILHPNSGYDNFSIDWLNQFSIPVFVGNEIRAQGVSDYITSIVLGELAPVKNYSQWPSKRYWPRSLLSESRFLLIGAGHIGLKIHNYFAKSSKRFDIIDPFFQNNPHDSILDSNTKHYQSLNDYSIEDLKQLDFVIVCCSLNPSSKNLITKSLLQKMSPNLCLINAARAEIIHEQELLEHLCEHISFRAYLDVFSKEPFAPNNYLKKNGTPFENLFKTPHIAGVYGSLEKDMILWEVEKLVEYFKFKEQIKEEENILKLTSFKTNFKKNLLQNRQYKNFYI